MKIHALFFLAALPPLIFAETPAAAQPAAAAETPAMQRDARCGQVVVRCTMNGVPLRLILDTGATHTVLDPATVARIPGAQKMDTSGMQFNSSSSRNVPDIYLMETEAGGRTFSPHPVLVLPLGGVMQMMATPIDGIMGMDLLKHLPFTLDFRPDGQSHWGEAHDGVAIHLNARPDDNYCPMLTIKVGDKELSNVLLDSGSSSTIFAAEDWSAGEERKVTLQTADVNGGAAEGIGIGREMTVELAPGAEQQVRPQLRSAKRSDAAGLIGVDSLRGYRLIYSPQKGFYLMK